MHLSPFNIIGISTRTTNQNGQAAADIGQLYDKFYANNILSRIPDRLDDDLYTLYTDYESNYTGAYTTIIGCKVSSLSDIPEGLIGREFAGGTYQQYAVQGELPEAVINQWQIIWDQDETLNRAYSVDFEVYGAKAQNPANAEVELYIAIK